MGSSSKLLSFSSHIEIVVWTVKLQFNHTPPGQTIPMHSHFFLTNRAKTVYLPTKAFKKFTSSLHQKIRKYTDRLLSRQSKYSPPTLHQGKSTI